MNFEQIETSRTAGEAEANADDLVAVPRGLLSAACGAIYGKRHSPRVLAELRRYTFGDLSDSASVSGSRPPKGGLRGN